MMNERTNVTINKAMEAIKTYGGYYGNYSKGELVPTEKVLGVCEVFGGELGIITTECYCTINEVYVHPIGYAYTGGRLIPEIVHCNEMANKDDIIRYNNGVESESRKIRKVLYVDGKFIDLLGEETKEEAETEEKEELTMKEKVKMWIKKVAETKIDMTKMVTLTTVFNLVVSVLAGISIARRGYKEHYDLCRKYFGKLVLLSMVLNAIAIVLSKEEE